MRRSLLLLVFGASGAAIAFACGLDVKGGATTSADATPDASGEGGVEGVVHDDDASVDFDAGIADASCDATTFDDPLTSIDGKWLLDEQNNADRPTIRTGPTGDRVSFIGGGRNGARGTMVLKTPVPTTSFDVQFKFAFNCSVDWWGGCADGMAVWWLDPATTPIATAIKNATTGATFGIPNGLRGAAVGIDIHRNDNTLDPNPPAIEILALDGVRPPAGYTWIVKGASGDFGGSRAHTMRLHLRGGLLSIDVDTKPLFEEVTVPVTMTSAFGFSAATGGENGVFYVWDFHAAFVDCAVP